MEAAYEHSAEQVLSTLDVSEERGLSATEVRLRTEKYGRNGLCQQCPW